ncbi:hypothetical protein KC19_4G102500 [Ceratodon purpureus]|uniref:Uncharacterized protein n=1 Tax=Ceratodon purpureus TaxID=3225 RepID=A0A8T0IAJ0_CERPU|nr:hypothetical protein KC19_4G102500 [Ceratodon purpureus]
MSSVLVCKPDRHSRSGSDRSRTTLKTFFRLYRAARSPLFSDFDCLGYKNVLDFTYEGRNSVAFATCSRKYSDAQDLKRVHSVVTDDESGRGM